MAAKGGHDDGIGGNIQVIKSREGILFVACAFAAGN
jgi:hypothetical protein